MFVHGGIKCKEVLVLGGIEEVQGSIGWSVEGLGADQRRISSGSAADQQRIPIWVWVG